MKNQQEFQSKVFWVVPKFTRLCPIQLFGSSKPYDKHVLRLKMSLKIQEPHLKANWNFTICTCKNEKSSWNHQLTCVHIFLAQRLWINSRQSHEKANTMLAHHSKTEPEAHQTATISNVVSMCFPHMVSKKCGIKHQEIMRTIRKKQNWTWLQNKTKIFTLTENNFQQLTIN